MEWRRIKIEVKRGERHQSLESRCSRKSCVFKSFLNEERVWPCPDRALEVILSRISVRIVWITLGAQTGLKDSRWRIAWARSRSEAQLVLCRSARCNLNLMQAATCSRWSSSGVRWVRWVRWAPFLLVSDQARVFFIPFFGKIINLCFLYLWDKKIYQVCALRWCLRCSRRTQCAWKTAVP